MPKQTLKEQIIKILGSITPSDYYETSFLGLNEAGDETFSDYADQILSLLKEEKKKWEEEYDKQFKRTEVDKKLKE